MALWTPADSSATVQLWIDVDDAATRTDDGTSISALADKSGNGHDFDQAVAGSRPTLNTTAFPGLTAMEMDGTQFLEAVSTSPNTNSNELQTFFVVFRRATINVHTLPLASSATLNAYPYYWFSNNQHFSSFYGDGAGNDAQSWALDLATGNFIITATASGPGSRSLHKNGTELTNTSADFDTDGGALDLIGRRSVSESTTGVICEIILVDGALSTNARQLFEGYLAHKWGLEGSLPGNHIYKSAAPENPINTRAQMPGVLGNPAVFAQSPLRTTAQMPGLLGEIATRIDFISDARAQLPGLLGAPRVRLLNDFTPLIVNSAARYILQVSTDPVTEIPISSWQATLQTGRQSYLQAVIPGYDQYVDVLAPLVGSGTFSIIRRADTAFGTFESLMASAPISQATVQSGPINTTATISGYSDEFLVAEFAGARTLQGIQTQSQSVGGSVRVRAEVDWFLRPGDTATAGDLTFTADFIQYFVTRSGLEYMDTGSRGSG